MTKKDTMTAEPGHFQAAGLGADAALVGGRPRPALLAQLRRQALLDERAIGEARIEVVKAAERFRELRGAADQAGAEARRLAGALEALRALAERRREDFEQAVRANLTPEQRVSVGNLSRDIEQAIAALQQKAPRHGADGQPREQDRIQLLFAARRDVESIALAEDPSAAVREVRGRLGLDAEEP